MMTLANLRKHIDDIDEELVQLLNRRTAISIQIGHIKKEQSQHGNIQDPKREAYILTHVKQDRKSVV